MTEPAQRLDKWLWFARIVKTRSLATKLVESGKVRVNRVRVSKPSRPVRAGDVVTASVHRRVRVLEIVDCGQRRGPAAEAALLFEDLSPPPPRREDPEAKPGPPATREPGSGRPTKRERRRIEAWTERDRFTAD